MDGCLPSTSGRIWFRDKSIPRTWHFGRLCILVGKVIHAKVSYVLRLPSNKTNSKQSIALSRALAWSIFNLSNGHCYDSIFEYDLSFQAATQPQEQLTHVTPANMNSNKSSVMRSVHLRTPGIVALRYSATAMTYLRVFMERYKCYLRARVL